MNDRGNQPAFPNTETDMFQKWMFQKWQGITLREYYAGLALQGLLAREYTADAAQKAVELAETLLDELEKP
jgi:hypothetical protein